MLIRYLFGNCRRRRPYNIETSKQHYPKTTTTKPNRTLLYSARVHVGFVFNIKHSWAIQPMPHHAIRDVGPRAFGKGWIDRALHKSMLHRHTRVHAGDQEGCVHIKVEVMLELLSFSVLIRSVSFSRSLFLSACSFARGRARRT